MAEEKKRNLFIIVIYAEDILSCTTITSLLSTDAALFKDVGMYFYINGKKDFTREIQKMFSEKCGELHTFYDGKNKGIVYAYKKATMDVGKDFGWITLLDQDSVFDDKFLLSLRDLSKTDLDHSTVAVAPHVQDDKQVEISPCRLFLGKGFPYTAGFGYVACINSMTTFRSEFLTKIAPEFPVDFFLDAFDFWLFYQIHKRKLKVLIRENVRVSHSLSLPSLEDKLDDVYWAREVMTFINTSRISPLFFPFVCIRFVWRLIRVVRQTGNIKYLNLVDMYKTYRHFVDVVSQ